MPRTPSLDHLELSVVLREFVGILPCVRRGLRRGPGPTGTLRQPSLMGGGQVGGLRAGEQQVVEHQLGELGRRRGVSGWRRRGAAWRRP